MQYYSPELINDSLLLCNVLKVNSEELSKIGSMFSYQENRKKRSGLSVKSTIYD